MSIDHNLNKLTIGKQCELLNISRSSYYYQPGGYSEYDLKVMALIDETYIISPYYDMRLMAKYLQTKGYAVDCKGARCYYK